MDKLDMPVEEYPFMLFLRFWTVCHQWCISTLKTPEFHQCLWHSSRTGVEEEWSRLKLSEKDAIQL